MSPKTTRDERRAGRIRRKKFGLNAEEKAEQKRKRSIYRANYLAKKILRAEQDAVYKIMVAERHVKYLENMTVDERRVYDERKELVALATRLVMSGKISERRYDKMLYGPNVLKGWQQAELLFDHGFN